jgi:hypothetical protein
MAADGMTLMAKAIAARMLSPDARRKILMVWDLE